MSDRSPHAQALRSTLLLAGALVAAAATVAPAAAQPPTTLEARADAGLARAKSRAGGPLWNGKTTEHLRYRVEVAGRSGTGESWTDLATGRYLDRQALGAVSVARGFDGERSWTREGSGPAHAESGDAVPGAIGEAYRRSLSYWFPGRRAGRRATAGEKIDGERKLAIYRCEPEGGRPFELWIDVATGWIDRTVEETARGARTVFYSDYRKSGGVTVPFEIHSTNGDPKDDTRIHVDSVAWNEPLAASTFEMPATGSSSATP